MPGEARIPRFAFLIGAMKAGTTTLFRGLEEHPQVAACEPKEPEYFYLERQHRRGQDWYESLFGWDPSRHAIALEGSTGSTKPAMFPEGFQRLRSFAEGRDVRFLYMVRDPLARIESHYRHSQARPFFRPHRDGWPDDEMVQVSDYAAMLDPYRDAFGRDRIRVIALDDLRERPGEVLREACRFLGIRDDLDWPTAEGAQNRSEEFLTFRPAWNPLLRPFPERETRTWLMGLVKPGRPPSRLAPLFFTGRRPQYRLPDEARREIHARLEPSMQRLRRDWGIDVSRWGF